jgi:2-hydroxychromene-2-carboxylate isomerase
MKTLRLLIRFRRVHWASVAVVICFMLLASLNAHAEGSLMVTPELLDSQRGPDGTWPKDPAVPELPPLADADDPGLNPNSFLTTHFTVNVQPAKISNPPETLKDTVNVSNPLRVDVYWSMRSPYSYLAMQRLLYLQSNYNVDMTIRFLMPIAVRSTKGGSGKAGGMFGISYKVPDLMWDTRRQGQYLGVPFKYAVPDPVWQDLYPPHVEGYQYVHPPEKQPYIHWVTRLGAYAQLKGKSVEYIDKISYLIWSGEVEHWPAHVKERFNQIEGLDYDKAIRFIGKNPEKVDQVWLDNADAMALTGHGGVPLMVFQNEPFFGGDRFDQFVWRLRESGLTRRIEPKSPMVTEPLRWPVGL